MLDIQVNGYAGVDFNREGLTGDALRHACACLSRDGVTGILATVITDHIAPMERKIAALARFCEEDPESGATVVGIHIEGPFLSALPGYRGAHLEAAIHPARLDEMKRLVDAGHGRVRLVTLAPEADPQGEVTAWLVEQEIVVAAGHTDATLSELDRCLERGLSVFTHLGNACPMQMPRHDNIVQRALSRADRLTTCFIADGIHVPYFALGNYLKVVGVERAIFVSDAISAGGMPPGRYSLGDWEVDVGVDGAVRAPDGSHLVGAATPLPLAAARAAEALGLSEEDIHALTCANPQRLLR